MCDCCNVVLILSPVTGSRASWSPMSRTRCVGAGGRVSAIEGIPMYIPSHMNLSCLCAEYLHLRGSVAIMFASDMTLLQPLVPSLARFLPTSKVCLRLQSRRYYSTQRVNLINCKLNKSYIYALCLRPFVDHRHPVHVVTH